MKRNNEKIRIMGLCLALIGIICAVAYSFFPNNNSAGDSIVSEQKIIEGQLIRGQLNNDIGKNTIYPKYYVALRIYGKNTETIEEHLVEDAAVQWWASQNNVDTSEEEVDSYIESLILDAKESDEYDIYEKAAKELGTTFEAAIKEDKETYREMIVKSKVYNTIIGGDQKIEVSSDDLTELENKRSDEWKMFLDSAVSEYKKTGSYKRLVAEIKVCRKLTSKEGITTQDVIDAYNDNGCNI